MHTDSTIIISSEAIIGKNTKIWYYSQIRENAKIGENCIIGKNVYIDHDVQIGNNVKIQNNCSIYYMTVIEDGVFIGPHVILTNDRNPRAVDISGKIKSASEWKAEKTTIKKGASIGAGSILLPGVTIGEFAMVGAGSVVTKNVDSYSLVFGNPAKHHGFVCKCGIRMESSKPGKKNMLYCSTCKTEVQK